MWGDLLICFLLDKYLGLLQSYFLNFLLQQYWGMKVWVSLCHLKLFLQVCSYPPLLSGSENNYAMGRKDTEILHSTWCGLKEAVIQERPLDLGNDMGNTPF